MYNIKHIHKSGDKLSVKNYRPICIQSALLKLLEKLLLSKISFVLKNVISSRRHGFINGRSTVTNLFNYTNAILEAMDKEYEMHAVQTSVRLSTL